MTKPNEMNRHHYCCATTTKAKIEVVEAFECVHHVVATAAAVCVCCDEALKQIESKRNSKQDFLNNDDDTRMNVRNGYECSCASL